MIEYQEAVQNSKTFIQSALSDDWAKIASGEVFAMSLARMMLHYDPEQILAWAETEADAFDALRLGVADLLEGGKELPPDVLQWLVRHLRGEASRPKARAGAKREPWLHLHISWAVGHCVYAGMKATRNDASEPTSGCDAVADALAELGLKPTTFDGVKRIWLNYLAEERGHRSSDLNVGQ